jgi:phosphomannomutase
VGESSVATARWEDLFRGYDIRARYPSEIGPKTAKRLGRALGRALPGPFLLGRDSRSGSASLSREVETGLRSVGARIDRLGIVPTPEVAFLAHHLRQLGLAVTPSHNAVGYVGLKGFTPSGRVFDGEWLRVRDAFERDSVPGSRGGGRPASTRAPAASLRAEGSFEEDYLLHLTHGLASALTVVLDTRGGATARVAPAALGRLGARVVEMRKGFSPTFFGQSPEPRPENLKALSDRVIAIGADLGFAFDGDGDRCVILDEGGRRAEPEVVGLLLHSAFATARSPIVASVDASRTLERHVRTVRSRVGSRFVARTMRRTGAEVGVEPSGHYYVRRYGTDSDGILIACLVAHALGTQGIGLGAIARRFGKIYRGTRTVDFPRMADARLAYRRMVQRLGKRARTGLDGFTVNFPQGWCLVRPSNTQPSIRFAYEATRSRAFRPVEQATDRIVRLCQPANP